MRRIIGSWRRETRRRKEESDRVRWVNERREIDSRLDRSRRSTIRRERRAQEGARNAQNITSRELREMRDTHRRGCGSSTASGSSRSRASRRRSPSCGQNYAPASSTETFYRRWTYHQIDRSSRRRLGTLADAVVAATAAASAGSF